MKKWLKITLSIIGIIALFIIAILYYSISYIDTTPYFETQYYSNTIEKLNSSLANRKSETGNLQAGFSRINITPTIVEGIQDPQTGKFNSIKLSGYGDGKFATGTHDSIYAKAITLKINNSLAILVSADLLLMPPYIVQKIEEKLKDRSDIKREQIIFGATHTHASIGNSIPSYVGEEFGGEYQPEVVEWLADKITKLILSSVADLKLSQVASDFIHVPNLIKNRIIGETGRLNDRLTIISIKQNYAKSAVIGMFAAHATTIGPWNNLFSADYPGYFQRTLEEKGIDMAMFFAGTVGSHTNKGKGYKFEKVEYIGKVLADSALVVINKMKYSDEVNFSMVTSKIEIPKLQIIYLSDGLRLSQSVGLELMPELTTPYVQSVMLNNLIWLTMPCELSGEYAIDLQNALELEGFNSAITSFNGEYLGYIVPQKYYYFDTYESRLMGWFGPSMGDYLMELNYTIADSLTDSRL